MTTGFAYVCFYKMKPKFNEIDHHNGLNHSIVKNFNKALYNF